jgi:hypothetical protein
MEVTVTTINTRPCNAHLPPYPSPALRLIIASLDTLSIIPVLILSVGRVPCPLRSGQHGELDHQQHQGRLPVRSHAFHMSSILKPSTSAFDP